MYYEGSLEPYVILFLSLVSFIGVGMGIPLLRGAWRQATEYLGFHPQCLLSPLRPPRLAITGARSARSERTPI